MQDNTGPTMVTLTVKVTSVGHPTACAAPVLGTVTVLAVA